MKNNQTMNKTTKTLIKLGATLAFETIIFLGTKEKGRNILKKSPKLCAWMEKKEKEREERRKQEEAKRAERERQEAIRRAEQERRRKLREEQRREEERIRNIDNYYRKRYFALLRENWPLIIDPETRISDISEFDQSIKQSLYNYGIYHVSGLLYHYLKNDWRRDYKNGKQFADISGIGVKRSALIVHYIQSNAKSWNKLHSYGTQDMDKCRQEYYCEKLKQSGRWAWS